MQPYSQEIEANFLSSYYEQDGNNSAVTGGIGTEKLADFANVFIINIPLDSVRAINFYSGADFYTSASTDNIDNNVSSASRQDLRGFGTVSYSRLNLKKSKSHSTKVGFSAEYDYTSISVGFSNTKEWNEANSEITISGQIFFGKWQLFFPVELRSTVNLPSSDRQTYNGQIIFSQVLNKRTQMSLSAEVIYLTGLLSTPFHRVYFSDVSSPDIERLPRKKLAVPLSIRLNYYPMDNLVLRTYYRYYWDDFGIRGNTVEIETPIKLGMVISLSPFFRFHTQTATDYFEPYQTHISTQEFYTSDYDLSALSSHNYGLGIKYYPLYGLIRYKPFFKNKKLFMIKYLEFRGSLYTRNTGLNAFITSLNVGFSIR